MHLEARAHLCVMCKRQTWRSIRCWCKKETKWRIRFAFRSFILSFFLCVVSFYRSILLSCAFRISLSVSFSVPHVLFFNHNHKSVGLVCRHRWSWSLMCIFNESSPAEEASRIKTKAFNNVRSQWKLSFRNELFSVIIGMFEILFILESIANDL